MGTAHSYTMFSFGPINWNEVKEVDVFVAGYGPEMGGLFAYSAITSARYMKENSPSSRAQIIFWAQEKSPAAHRNDIESRRLHVLKSDSQGLTVDRLYRHLQSFPRINSLHFFSHSGAWAGITLQSGEDRLDDKTMDWRALKSKFTPNSFVFLHSCNSGFVLAPRISELIERPVFGSLTGTDFQEIYANNQWYHHNNGQFPQGMSKLVWNEILFGGRHACWMGNCHRMKPNNHAYSGAWGRYTTGLPYYRPFCRYGSNLRGQESRDCLQGVAGALRAWPVEPRMSDRERALDFICPIYPGRTSRQDCLRYLRDGNNNVGRIFWSNTLNCTLTGCDYTTSAARTRGGNPTQVFNSQDAGNAPFRADYQLFSRALAL